jgi:phenylpyruvate tautomerase PptA (4-oxalocrotonate tautomerase family)
MPMINLTVPAGALEPPAREALLDELAGTLLRWERAPDTEFFRSITWVYAHEIARDAFAPGGRLGGDARFRVDITVPQGALSERRKEGLVADVTTAVLRAAGLDEADGLRVWTLIYEVPEGNWGAAGQIVRYSRLVEAARAQSEQANPATALASGG